MNKKIVGLLALSLVVFSLYAVSGDPCADTDRNKQVLLINNTDEAAKFMVMS